MGLGYSSDDGPQGFEVPKPQGISTIDYVHREIMMMKVLLEKVESNIKVITEHLLSQGER